MSLVQKTVPRRVANPARLLRRGIAVISLALTAIGCSGSDLSKPMIEPEAMAQAALAALDKNSDGAIDAAEAAAAPGLLEGLPRADSDGDGRLSAGELQARFQSWADSPLYVANAECVFTQRKRPIADAEVIFEPEPFLAEYLEPIKCRTDAMGSCRPQLSRELPGMSFGYYRVKVSKTAGGRESIAPQFNSKTVLGVEFCPDRRDDVRGVIPIDLSPSRAR